MTNQNTIASDYSHLVPRIDIALVGVGPDGHIASLFPHHPLLDSVESGYLEIIDSPKPPAHRITVSPEMLTSAPYAFVAFMQGKEEAYTHFLDPTLSVTDCPVKMLTSCDHLVVMSDIDE
jgi:6-phosphogluconolactonase